MPRELNKYILPNGTLFKIQIEQVKSNDLIAKKFENEIEAENEVICDKQMEKSTGKDYKTPELSDINGGVETAVIKDIITERKLRKAKFNKLLDEHQELVEQIKKMEMKSNHSAQPSK
ncbi:unnamed protein product [Phyllotreta striolata]|uniref:Uncharacterized protein n=1 Tax=Phyllotreta striolata TaxID=444603 RepID=A0A9N9XNA1_PHYSR|nr:unnamed protein product [Phyllotreta striolata]